MITNYNYSRIVSKETTMLDITIILVAHAEGQLLGPTLKSLAKAQQIAEARGLKTEVIILLDNPTVETKTQAEQHELVNKQIVTVANRNLAQNRNHGAKLASGKYLAFLDGDDLFAPNWLSEAYKFAQADGGRAAYHAEYAMFFGRENFITKFFSSINFSAENLLGLMTMNPWIALCFVSKELALAIPYTPIPAPLSSAENPFGYEDWHWYSKLLAAGKAIKVVPNSSIFIRRKLQGSMLQHYAQTKKIIPPTPLFAPEFWQDYRSDWPPKPSKGQLIQTWLAYWRRLINRLNRPGQIATAIYPQQLSQAIQECSQLEPEITTNYQTLPLRLHTPPLPSPLVLLYPKLTQLLRKQRVWQVELRLASASLQVNNNLWQLPQPLTTSDVETLTLILLRLIIQIQPQQVIINAPGLGEVIKMYETAFPNTSLTIT